MKMLKWKPFVGIVVVVAMVSALMLPVSATSLEENDFIVSAEELKGAEIKIEDENIITITTRTLSSLNDTVMTRGSSEAQNREELNVANVNTTILLVNDSEETESVYNDLLAEEHEGSNYRSNSDVVAGLSAYTTVYFTVQEVDGYNWYRLTRITGGNTKPNENSSVIGSGFMIGEQSVVYGCAGSSLEGHPGYMSWTDEEELSNTDDSFDIQVEDLHPDWPTIYEYNSVLGGTYSIKIHSVRDGEDTWLDVTNNILDGFSIEVR